MMPPRESAKAHRPAMDDKGSLTGAQDWLRRFGLSVMKVIEKAGKPYGKDLFQALDIILVQETVVAEFGALDDDENVVFALLLSHGGHGDWYLTYYFLCNRSREARAIASAGNKVFPAFRTPPFEADRLPFDTPLLIPGDHKVRTTYGVDSSAPISLHQKPDPLLITDVAFFFYSVVTAVRRPMAIPITTSSYGRRSEQRIISPPGKESVISKARCPRCKQALTSYSRACEFCGWGVRDRHPSNSDSRYGYEQSDT
jgi:hypothetical protein